MSLHVRGQQASCLAFVKIFRAHVTDALERAGQLGLLQPVAWFEVFPVIEKNSLRFWKAAEAFARVF